MKVGVGRNEPLRANGGREGGYTVLACCVRRLHPRLPRQPARADCHDMISLLGSVTDDGVDDGGVLPTGGERGEHVAAICECVEANRYLSPAGSEAYLIEDKHSFERRGIEVLIQMYEHPEYVQRYSPFIPFASALDLIFNHGPEAGDILRSGRRLARALGENTLNNLEEVHHEN